MRQYRILVAGNWRSLLHEEPLSKAFERIGCVVEPFKWYSYFSGKDAGPLWQQIWMKIEYRFSFGLVVEKINKDLVDAVTRFRPDIVLVYRPILISKKTIEKLKLVQSNPIVVSYNNDNPFSTIYKWYFWRRYKKSIASYDVVFSYRPSNIQAYEVWGARAVYLLPPWFVPEHHYPVKLDVDDQLRYQSDIVFIGHYEDDGRINIIKALVKNGLSVALYGPEWDNVIKKDPVLSMFYPVKYLTGAEYNKALCGAKMALVIYSTLNNDVYSRRCFEIPATETMIIAKRTREMEGFFKENVEAVFFDHIDELIEKALYYAEHKSLCRQIGLKGRERAIASGYDVTGRATQIIRDIEASVELEKTCLI